MAGKTVREAVGVFHDETSLQNAADELLIAGFDRASLSLLASEHAIEEKLGHKYERVVELEDDDVIPRRAFSGSDSRTEAKGVLIGGLMYIGAVGAVGAIVASGGTIAAVISAAVAAGGAGGLVGSVLAGFIDKKHARRIQEQLDHGGLLLWVTVNDEQHAEKACEIFRRCDAEHVHLHELPAVEFTKEGGVSHDTSFMNRLNL